MESRASTASARRIGRHTLGIGLCWTWMVIFLSRWPLSQDLGASLNVSHYLIYYSALGVLYAVAFAVLHATDRLPRKALGIACIVAGVLPVIVWEASLVFPSNPLSSLLMLAALCAGQLSMVLLQFVALIGLRGKIPSLGVLAAVTVLAYLGGGLLTYPLTALAGPCTATLSLLAPAAFLCLRDLLPTARIREPLQKTPAKDRASLAASLVVFSGAIGVLTSVGLGRFGDVGELPTMFMQAVLTSLIVLFLVQADRAHLFHTLSLVLGQHVVTKAVNIAYYAAPSSWLEPLGSGVALIVVCLAICGAVALLYLTGTYRLMAPAPAAAAPAPDAVEEVGSRHGLTPRETEILRLLSEGRSLPYIQDALSIAGGTARTHAGNIYKKLGVHNRQELISLVEKTRQSGRADDHATSPELPKRSSSDVSSEDL